MVICFNRARTRSVREIISSLGIKAQFFKPAGKVTNLDDIQEKVFKFSKNTNLDVQAKVFKSSKNMREFLPLSDVLEYLYREGKLQSILVEGGAFCHAQFLKEKLAQRLYLYIAPKVIGSGGKSWSGDFFVPSLSETLNLNIIQKISLGNDLLLESFFKY